MSELSMGILGKVWVKEHPERPAIKSQEKKERGEKREQGKEEVARKGPQKASQQEAMKRIR